MPHDDHPLSEPRWLELWQRLGSDAPDGSFAELLAAYGEPQRRYHSHVHILACLRHFDEWRHLAEQPDQVELALWAHDLVYDTRRQDNEAASAERTAQWLREADLQQLGAPVSALILATCHRQPAQGIDTALVVDIDLAILATPPAIYAEYESAVRAEFAWVPEPLFRAGRSKVLRHLLEMPALYQHEALARRWEQPARGNLQRALASLQG